MARVDTIGPFSILFPEPAESISRAGEEAEEPDFFADLNLDQVIAAAVQGRDEYRLHGFYRSPLHDEGAVRYRQDVFRDLEAGLAPEMAEFGKAMQRARSHMAAVEQRGHGYSQAAWFLDGGSIYCDAVERLQAKLSGSSVASDGLGRFCSYLSAYLASEAFRSLNAETKRLKAELAAVTYGVRFRGSRVSVTPYNNEADYSKAVIATFQKFQQGDVQSRLVKYSPEFNNHIQERIVDLVARIHPGLFAALLRYTGIYRHFLDPVIARFDREIQFYLGYLALVERIKRAGLNFCYPDLSTASKAIRAAEAFDLALATKLAGDQQRVVCNDFELRDGERIFVVSGPNQGGKTTFARMFGQLHFVAALGCPVPGVSAQLFLPDRIFAHFEKQEQVEDLRSKLEDELLRVRQTLAQATDRSIVVMNESLASTTADDALFLGREVLGRLLELGAFAVYVTFIDELSRLGPSVVSMVSTVVPENPAERTFKVVRKPADGRSFATAIAERHGLTLGAIRERLRK